MPRIEKKTTKSPILSDVKDKIWSRLVESVGPGRPGGDRPTLIVVTDGRGGVGETGEE